MWIYSDVLIDLMIMCNSTTKAPVSQANHHDLITLYSLRNITLRNAT
jgi:hypothetical protein